MPVNPTVASEYLAKVGRPIPVRMITAGQSWKDRQVVQYHGMYNEIRKDFTHLQDLKKFLGTYTIQLHGILKYLLYQLISMVILRTIEALKSIVRDSVLGQVSKGLRQFGNIAESFGLTPIGLQNIDDAIESAQDRLGA